VRFLQHRRAGAGFNRRTILRRGNFRFLRA